MPRWMRWSGLGLGLLVLISFVYTPLLRAGFLATDARALLEATGETVPAPTAEVALLRAPLERLSLRLSRGLWGLGSGAATGARLENLALLCLAAAGMALFLRRLLLPWTGRAHAAAAATAAAVILALHPLAVAAVADVRSRGELLSLALGAWALCLFLRGRQDRRPPITAVSLALCALSALAGDLALGLPFFLAGAELLSSHRYRPLRVRLRTTATTFVVFGAAVVLDLLLHLGRLGPEGLPPTLSTLREASGEESELGRLLVEGVEKLGLLVLPSNPFVTGIAGLALAGAVFLLAMQPGLSAARSAPRLWGWILCGWFAALVGSALLHAHVRVSHAELSPARMLLSSAAVMAAGLGIGATAVSGLRRTLFPAVVVLGYAALGHANALPWEAAATEAGRLRTDLLQARERHGRDAVVFVLDPPRATRGVDPVGDSVGWLLHPALEGGRRRASASAPAEVRGLTRDAFLALVDEPEFDDLRRTGLVVLFERGALEPDLDPEEARERRALRLDEPRGERRSWSWRGESRSPELDLDPLRIGALTLARTSRAALDQAGPQVRWRGREAAIPGGSLRAPWLEPDGRRGAVFDLGSSLAWRLGGRVRRAWFEGAGESVEAVFEPALPLFAPDPAWTEGSDGAAMLPVKRGPDWHFPPPPPELLADGRSRFVVRVLDLVELEVVEFPARVFEHGLRVVGVRDWVEEAVRRGGGPVAYALDCRVEGATVARVRGRRVALPEQD